MIENIEEKVPITEVQLKFCATIIAKLKKNVNASPFLKPVDPIALGIPDYFEKIKTPMDISTIKQRIDAKMYTTLEEFNGDVVLMFENCYAYNLKESAVYCMGRDLQSLYESLYSEMPSERKTEAEAKNIEKAKKVKGAENMSGDDFQYCSEILGDLEKIKHRKYSWPFLLPVSEEDVPGYFEVIKNPMDLSTIRNKLEAKKYGSISGFICDLNLIVENCFKFNTPESEVYKYCVDFNKAIQGLLSNEKDINVKINELRRRIAVMNSELKVLEGSLLTAGKQIFSLGDRERIGKAIISMNKGQTEKVAEIIQRHCAYEYVDNDEIEVNLQTIPDEVAGEIDAYIQKIKSGDNAEPSNSSED